MPSLAGQISRTFAVGRHVLSIYLLSGVHAVQDTFCKPVICRQPAEQRKLPNIYMPNCLIPQTKLPVVAIPCHGALWRSIWSAANSDCLRRMFGEHPPGLTRVASRQSLMTTRLTSRCGVSMRVPWMLYTACGKHFTGQRACQACGCCSQVIHIYMYISPADMLSTGLALRGTSLIISRATCSCILDVQGALRVHNGLQRLMQRLILHCSGKYEKQCWTMHCAHRNAGRWAALAGLAPYPMYKASCGEALPCCRWLACWGGFPGHKLAASPLFCVISSSP